MSANVCVDVCMCDTRLVCVCDYVCESRCVCVCVRVLRIKIIVNWWTHLCVCLVTNTGESMVHMMELRDRGTAGTTDSGAPSMFNTRCMFNTSAGHTRRGHWAKHLGEGWRDQRRKGEGAEGGGAGRGGRR